MGSAFSSSDRLKMRVFLGVLSCIAAASATTLLQAQWSKFKADHGKVYGSPAEEALNLCTERSQDRGAEPCRSVLEEWNQPIHRPHHGEEPGRLWVLLGFCFILGFGILRQDQ